MRWVQEPHTISPSGQAAASPRSDGLPSLLRCLCCAAQTLARDLLYRPGNGRKAIMGYGIIGTIILIVLVVIALRFFGVI
jgi:hypothetical protein